MLTTTLQIMFHIMLIINLQNLLNQHFPLIMILETMYLTNQMKISIKDSILIITIIIKKIMLNLKWKLTIITLIMTRDIILMEEVLIQDLTRSVRRLEKDFDQYFIMNYYFINYHITFDIIDIRLVNRLWNARSYFSIDR